MAVKPRPRQLRAHQAKRSQERSDRTRALVIAETIRCIREEGFAAASTRHIMERAGVTWGVVQYHFGDRDGLLTAVIDDAFTTLIDSLNSLADQSADVIDMRARAASLTAAAWEIFFSPTCMTAMEILLATRNMRGTLDAEQLADVQQALLRIAALIEGPTPHAVGVANLLWASPVGMMMAQSVMTDALPTELEQRAMADLIADHLQLRRESNPPKQRQRRRSRT
jgi:TetR/AcrR family transcriptional regulator, regulator of cefoperazone and chloramphenicol sensitivity